MLEPSPALKIGTTFAILNWAGTTPHENDRLKIWIRGSISEEIVCFKKFVDSPEKSGVFLSLRSFVASRISSLVSGLSLKLKMLGFWAINEVGDFGEKLTFCTVLLAILVKNSLKWLAITDGSLIFNPLIVKCEISLLFLLLLLMEENKICQVFLRFFLFDSSCFLKCNFFADLITRL